MRRPELRGVYAITDPVLTPGAELYRAVERALHGGVSLVQYRDKTADAAERRTRASALQELCRRHEVPLIINDDAQLARAIGAAGVHLGGADMPLAEARALLGTDAIIGISCYNKFETALDAAAAGADYVAFGSAFPSLTKPGAVRAPLTLYRRAKAGLRIPVCAIGGIDAGNAPFLIDCGVDMLAVISGIFAQNDIESAARRLVACLQESSPRSLTDQSS